MSARLNQIGDEAADDMREFYQRHLELDVQGSARYEAHLYLGLLAWRSGRQSAMDEVRNHLGLAAKTVATMLSKRADVEASEVRRPFEFMFPLFVVFIFGDRESRKKLSELSRTQWVSEGQDEYQSFIELMDLLRQNSLDLDFTRSSIDTVVKTNDTGITHPFYRPWIDAMCVGLYAILEEDCTGLELACKQLLELHEEEAWEGDWKLRLEGLIAFWPLSLIVIAKKYGLKPKVESDYLPVL